MTINKHLNIPARNSTKVKVTSQNVMYLPQQFSFRNHGAYNFDPVLATFDWSLSNELVRIDLSQCSAANYQALSLLVAYAWKIRNQGCRVSIFEGDDPDKAGAMWKLMGARGLFEVALHEEQNFKWHKFKPLIAIRNTNDFKKTIERAEGYTKGFNVEYMHTLEGMF